jgi:hypothetical protein
MKLGKSNPNLEVKMATHPPLRRLEPELQGRGRGPRRKGRTPRSENSGKIINESQVVDVNT